MIFKYTILPFIFAVLSSPTFAGPGDELNLPKKEAREEKKGVKGFASLLPANDFDMEHSQRNKGMAMNIDEADLKGHLKEYTKQYLARRERWYNTLSNTARYQNIFSLYDRILPTYGIPKELKYLSVIESDLQANAVSVAGATGPWQIMYDEAKSYNLIRGGRDLRTDYEASTHAAAKLIRTLYKRYDDWLLTLSAYNAGMGRVDRAIRQAGSKDFWKVQQFLPNETRHHVRRFIATHYFFEGAGGITTLTASESQKLQQKVQRNRGELTLTPGMEILKIKGIFNASTVARMLELDFKSFNHQNPDFNNTLARGQEYDMRIPSEKIPLFIAQKENILQEGIDEMLK